ncbi:MAG: sodium-dependent transporter, partial [Waddliaceae bacterium]
DSGPGLLFHTLPIIFGQISGGYVVAIMLFFLVVLTAITSEISAMEPTIAYLMDEWGWNRHAAVAVCGVGVFLLGIPSALSYSYLKDHTLFGANFFEAVSSLCSNILIPLGGFFAVILVGWFWGVNNAIRINTWLKGYFWFCFKYSAPILMIIVFLNALGLFA